MKIALIGYGKMGKIIEQIALKRNHQIVCVIDKHNLDDFESEAFAQADVAIEFTQPNVALANCLKAFAKNVKVVSGTTGWFEQNKKVIEEACEKEGKTLFWASNFSLGVSLFTLINQYVSKLMNEFPAYKPVLEETHHIHKLDAPSGTAITLAEKVIEKSETLKQWKLGKTINPDGSITGEDIDEEGVLAINAIRRDEVPGIHTVTYKSEVDEISLTHNAYGREGFALGAVLAAEYTFKHTGILGMSDLFKFDI